MSTVKVEGIVIGQPGDGNSGIGNGVLASYPSMDSELARLQPMNVNCVTIQFGDAGMIDDGIMGARIVSDSDDFVRNRAEAIGYIAERYFEHNVIWQPIVPSGLAKKALPDTLQGYHKQIWEGYMRANKRTGKNNTPRFGDPVII